MDYSKDLDSLWVEDEEFQTGVLDAILKDIRGVPDNYRATLLEYLKKEQMFYVPNDIYMKEVFGDDIVNYKYGIYNGDECKLCYRLAMPVRLLDNTVVGFIGYSNKDDFNENNESFIKYLYPPKYVLKKSRYVYCTREEFSKAIKEQYVCIVDGLFDQKVLSAFGINAISLCGSVLTDYHRLYLNSIKHKVIVADNDEAGRKMANVIKKYYSTAVEIYQDQAKDIDGFMKMPNGVEKVKTIIEQMKLEGFTLSHKLYSRFVRSDYEVKKINSKEN